MKPIIHPLTPIYRIFSTNPTATRLYPQHQQRFITPALSRGHIPFPNTDVAAASCNGHCATSAGVDGIETNCKNDLQYCEL